MQFTILIEQDEDAMYVAKDLDTPGRHTQGRTISQVLKRVKEAIQIGLESTPPSTNKP